MILGYVRCSTMEQAAEGTVTLQEQERKIRGVAMIRGVGLNDVVMFSDPGVSGSVALSERPGGKELMEAMKPGDIVVAAKLDRLFRSASDALITVEALQKQKVGVIFADIGTDVVTENGVSKLFFTMLSAFAEFERTRIAERMDEGRKGKRARNGFMGGVAPFGYRVEGEGRDAVLIEVESEQEIIRIVRSMQSAGPGKIARHLTNKGLLTRTGKRWQEVQIQRILHATH